MPLKLLSSQGPRIPLTRLLPTPGVCPMGNAAGPACGRWQPDLEPEGSPPSGPQGRASPALHPLCRRSPCQQLQLQAPCENHTAPIPGLGPVPILSSLSLMLPICSLQVAVGFSGCLKKLQLDKRPLRTPTQMVGVTPCVSGPLEDGLFFPGEGVVALGE